MKKDSLIRVHRIYGIILAVSIILAGICLVGGCLSIYFSGAQPYSRQAVADTFRAISVPVYICLMLTVIGAVSGLVLPSDVKPDKSRPNYTFVRKRLAEKKDIANCEKKLLDPILSEHKKRRFNSLILAILLGITSIVFFAYSLNAENYQADINRSVINVMWVIIPCFSVSAAFAVFALYSNEKSLKREIESLKQLPNSKNEITEKTITRHFERKLAVIRSVLLIAGVAIAVYGFASGGTADVLTKAINICTECIGLG